MAKRWGDKASSAKNKTKYQSANGETVKLVRFYGRLSKLMTLLPQWVEIELFRVHLWSI